MKRLLITILLISVCFKCFSTKNFGRNYQYGRVTVEVVSSSLDYYEIEKASILGLCCNSYLLRFDNRNTFNIYIQYYHRPYLEQEGNQFYLMSFDNGQEIDNHYNPAKLTKLLDNNGLVIRVFTDNLKINDILKLLDYGINNTKHIANQQSKFSWKMSECNTIDTSLIKRILLRPEKKKRIASTISNGLEFSNDSSNIMYIFKNNKYYFFDKLSVKQDPVLICNNIYQILDISSTVSLIFDTNYSFYIINLSDSMVQKKIIINSSINYYGTYAAMIKDSCVYLKKEEYDQNTFLAYNQTNNTLYENVHVTDSIFYYLHDIGNRRENLRVFNSTNNK